MSVKCGPQGRPPTLIVDTLILQDTGPGPGREGDARPFLVEEASLRNQRALL